jgi:hypothetical protein
MPGARSRAKIVLSVESSVEALRALGALLDGDCRLAQPSMRAIMARRNMRQ